MVKLKLRNYFSVILVAFSDLGEILAPSSFQRIYDLKVLL